MIESWYKGKYALAIDIDDGTTNNFEITVQGKDQTYLVHSKVKKNHKWFHEETEEHLDMVRKAIGDIIAGKEPNLPESRQKKLAKTVTKSFEQKLEENQAAEKEKARKAALRQSMMRKLPDSPGRKPSLESQEEAASPDSAKRPSLIKFEGNEETPAQNEAVTNKTTTEKRSKGAENRRGPSAKSRDDSKFRRRGSEDKTIGGPNMKRRDSADQTMEGAKKSSRGGVDMATTKTTPLKKTSARAEEQVTPEIPAVSGTEDAAEETTTAEDDSPRKRPEAVDAAEGESPCSLREDVILTGSSESAPSQGRAKVATAKEVPSDEVPLAEPSEYYLPMQPSEVAAQDAREGTKEKYAATAVAEKMEKVSAEAKNRLAEVTDKQIHEKEECEASATVRAIDDIRMLPPERTIDGAVARSKIENAAAPSFFGIFGITCCRGADDRNSVQADDMAVPVSE